MRGDSFQKIRTSSDREDTIIRLWTQNGKPSVSASHLAGKLTREDTTPNPLHFDRPNHSLPPTFPDHPSLLSYSNPDQLPPDPSLILTNSLKRPLIASPSFDLLYSLRLCALCGIPRKHPKVPPYPPRGLTW